MFFFACFLYFLIGVYTFINNHIKNKEVIKAEAELARKRPFSPRSYGVQIFRRASLSRSLEEARRMVSERERQLVEKLAQAESRVEAEMSGGILSLRSAIAEAEAAGIRDDPKLSRELEEARRMALLRDQVCRPG